MILQNLTRNYDILQKFMKVDKSYDIPQYFFGQITYFPSASFNCNVLLAFHNFIPWQMKFFCLLLYSFASRQHRQIFHHQQTKGDISNIADTYSILCQSKLSDVYGLELKVYFWGLAARPSTMANNAQLEELNAQLMETKLSIEGLEKERDFYFGKLRDIEVLCQVQPFNFC